MPPVPRVGEDELSSETSSELAAAADSGEEIQERELGKLQILNTLLTSLLDRRDRQAEVYRTEIDNLNQQLATLSFRLQGKDSIIHEEKQKVANLNIEILRVRLAVDQEARVYTDSHMMHIRSLLSDAERERDWYKEGVEEFRSRLKKSKKMNVALLEFVSQILVDGIYPECDWATLKLKQTS